MSDGYEVKLDPDIKNLDDFISKLGSEMGNVAVRKTALIVLKEVTYDTKIDTGLMNNNWRISRNVRSRKLFGANKNEGAPLSRETPKVSKIMEKDSVYIENNVEYAAEQNKAQGGILERAIKIGLSNLNGI